MKIIRPLTLMGLCLGLGCAGPEGALPPTLDALVVEDPTFTFATSAVQAFDVPPRLDVGAPIELRTADGALVLQGSFRDATSLRLRLPLETTRLVRSAGSRALGTVDVRAAR